MEREDIELAKEIDRISDGTWVDGAAVFPGDHRLHRYHSIRRTWQLAMPHLTEDELDALPDIVAGRVPGAAPETTPTTPTGITDADLKIAAALADLADEGGMIAPFDLWEANRERGTARADILPTITESDSPMPLLEAWRDALPHLSDDELADLPERLWG